MNGRIFNGWFDADESRLENGERVMAAKRRKKGENKDDGNGQGFTTEGTEE